MRQTEFFRQTAGVICFDHGIPLRRDPLWHISPQGRLWLAGTAAMRFEPISRAAAGQGGIQPVEERHQERHVASHAPPPALAAVFHEAAHHASYRPAHDKPDRLPPDDQVEEESDLMHGIMAAAVQEARRKAKAVRKNLRATLRGPELAASLMAARTQAKIDLAGIKAAIRRNFGYARASKRRRRRGSQLAR